MQCVLVLLDQGHVSSLKAELATVDMVLKIIIFVGYLLFRRNVMRVVQDAHAAGAKLFAE